MPEIFQTAIVFVLGVIMAAFGNYCVDRLDWRPRYRSPWRRFPEQLQVKGALPKRTWVDRIPIWGWARLARYAYAKPESVKKSSAKRTNLPSNNSESAYGWIPGWESRGFWIRPLLTEFLFGILIACRYSYWSTQASDATFGPVSISIIAWGVETLLFWFALCASLVDLDDYVIPDALMLPGFFSGLALSAIFPFLFAPPLNMPILWPLDWNGEHATFSVSAFTANALAKNGIAVTMGNVRAAIGIALTLAWSFWAFALLDRRFYLRLGLVKAFSLFFRRICRSLLTGYVAGLWIIGLVAIWYATLRFTSLEVSQVYSFNSLDALVNSMIGLLVGASLIWAVRLVGGMALGVEAMGFGDVILMGMIGAFIGWQGSIVVFFVAPFFGLVFGIFRRFSNTAPEIPYGPFLCLATVVYVFRREVFNAALAPYISDPVFALVLGGVGFVMLTVALVILRIVKSMIRRS